MPLYNVKNFSLVSELSHPYICVDIAFIFRSIASYGAPQSKVNVIVEPPEVRTDSFIITRVALHCLEISSEMVQKVLLA